MTELGVDRALFVGFSWGARIGCSFAARFPERTAGLALIDGGYVEPGDVGADLTADLNTCVAEAREEIEEDSFASWDAYFAFERESLKRWTPALEAAHRAAMREAEGRVVPILEPETLGAIKYGGRREPATDTYPLVAASGVPVLLLTASSPGSGAADEAVAFGPLSRGSSRISARRDPRSRLLRAGAGGRPHRRVLRRQPGRSAAAVDRDRQVEHDVVLAAGQLFLEPSEYLGRSGRCR